MRRNLAEQGLVDELRKRADTVTTRLWIASPDVGTWEAVQQILGINSFTRADVSVRLLTDISGSWQYLNSDTLRHFSEKG